jgi:hypothetical protein
VAASWILASHALADGKAIILDGDGDLALAQLLPITVAAGEDLPDPFLDRTVARRRTLRSRS